MNNRQAFQKVVFLDTNTLHYVGIYLEYARERSLYPYSQDIKEKAIANIDEQAEAGVKPSLKRGLRTVAYFLASDVQVQYSPISELELLKGRARGRALLSAAREGIPDRMWSRFPEKEISARVGVDELKEVKEKVDGLTSLLEKLDVAVKMSGGAETRDVLELAKGINGLVYMEPKDSIIYASTLVAEADYLFTNDDYLRKTINTIQGIRSSGDTTRDKEIRGQLSQLVSDIRLGTADEVELPSAHTITANGTVKPEIPVHEHDRSS